MQREKLWYITIKLLCFLKVILEQKFTFFLGKFQIGETHDLYTFEKNKK